MVKAVATVTVFSVFTCPLFSNISRALGAEVVGQYQICISMFYMFACFPLGHTLVLSRKTAETRALKKKAKALLTSALLLRYAFHDRIQGVSI